HSDNTIITMCSFCHFLECLLERFNCALVAKLLPFTGFSSWIFDIIMKTAGILTSVMEYDRKNVLQKPMNANIPSYWRGCICGNRPTPAIGGKRTLALGR